MDREKRPLGHPLPQAAIGDREPSGDLGERQCGRHERRMVRRRAHQGIGRRLVGIGSDADRSERLEFHRRERLGMLGHPEPVGVKLQEASGDPGEALIAIPKRKIGQRAPQDREAVILAQRPTHPELPCRLLMTYYSVRDR